MYTQCDWCGNESSSQMTTELGTYDFCADCTKWFNESEVAA